MSMEFTGVSVLESNPRSKWDLVHFSPLLDEGMSRVY